MNYDISEKYVVPLAGLALLVGIFILSGPAGHTDVTFDTDTGKVTVRAEVADTPEERTDGLTNKTLDPGEGMLFVFDDTGPKAFWMKDVPQNLDIIFLSEDKRVVGMFRNLSSCYTKKCPEYVFRNKALYALEVGAGFVEEHGIERGDRTSFTLGRQQGQG